MKRAQPRQKRRRLPREGGKHANSRRQQIQKKEKKNNNGLIKKITQNLSDKGEGRGLKAIGLDSQKREGPCCIAR